VGPCALDEHHYPSNVVLCSFDERLGTLDEVLGELIVTRCVLNAVAGVYELARYRGNVALCKLNERHCTSNERPCARNAARRLLTPCRHGVVTG
jgi:hypothetical protein